MKFNILYGKHENLSQVPLQEGNLYITDIGYMYMDIVNSDNELIRSEIVGKRDWNALEGDNGYIHNRTHWSEPEKVTIIEETTSPSLTEFIHGIPAYEWEPIGEDFRTLFSNLITAGMTCIVTIDGVKYESIAYEVPTGYYEHCVVVGDSRLYYEHFGELDGLPEEVASLNPQDVPFAIVNIVGVEGMVPEVINYDNSISVVTVPEGALFKLEKLTGNLIYHPLQEEYVPSTIARVSQIPHHDWQENDETKNTHIQGRTHYYGEEMYDLWSAENVVSYNKLFYEKGQFTNHQTHVLPYEKIPHNFFMNDTYIVTLDGIDYKVTSFLNEYDESFALGNINYCDYAPGAPKPSGEIPFCLQYIYDDMDGGGVQWHKYWEFITFDNEPHTISIKGYSEEQGYNKLDYRYVPSPSWSTYTNAEGYIKNRSHYVEPEWIIFVNKEFIPYNNIITITSYNNKGEHDFENNGFHLNQKYSVVFDGVRYDNLSVWSHTNNYGDLVNCIGDSRLTYRAKTNSNGNYEFDDQGNFIKEIDNDYPSSVPFAIECFEQSSEGTMDRYEWNYTIFTNIQKPDGIIIGKPTGKLTYQTINKNYIPDTVAMQDDLDALTEAMNASY